MGVKSNTLHYITFGTLSLSLSLKGIINNTFQVATGVSCMVNRRKYVRARTVSGKTEAWKAALLTVLDIPPTEVIEAGINLVLENKIYQGRGIVQALKLYREGLTAQIEELQEKIDRIDFALQDQEVKNSAAQLRIWDSEAHEERIIRQTEYNPEVHKIKEEIKVRSGLS